MSHPNHQSGQVVLTIIVFMVAMVIITTGATMVTIVNTQSSSVYETGTRTYALAESGIENAIMQFLRNPNYTGETLTLDGATITITTTNITNGKRIRSQARVSRYSRTVEADATYVNNVLTVTSWREVY